MTTFSTQADAIGLWSILNKEISGVQILWETVDGVYFKMQGQGLVTLAEDMPLFYGLMQTALMESLLMRLSRLMEPAVSGRGHGARGNLSLKRLAEVRSDISPDVEAVRDIWDASNLKHIRDKYLSHNDLARSLNEPHTLNVPLDETDVAVMRELAAGLREFRRKVHGKLNPDVTYLDESLTQHVQHEIDVLNRALLGRDLFFKLLPEHEALQCAWLDADRKSREER